MSNDDIQRLAELLRAFDALKRQRALFLQAFGGDVGEGDERRSYASRILAAALAAADAMATDALIQGHPAGKVDARAFRSGAKERVLAAVDQLGLLANSPPEPEAWPADGALFRVASPSPQAGAATRRGRR